MSFDNNFDNEKRIVIFRKVNKANEKQPDFTGTLTINGVAYDVALWDKVSAAGRTYHSGKITESADWAAEPADNPEGAPLKTYKAVEGDEIPF